MKGLMQDWPLLISRIITHAARFHPRSEIVTWSVEGPVHRTNYAELEERSRRLAAALAELGVGEGDRVATLAWNSWRHLEIWYGAAGMGAVVHTVNPRLFDDQIVYIMNHGGARVLCFDLTFLPIVARLKDRFETVAHLVVMSDAARTAEARAQSGIETLLSYEELVAAADPIPAWPEFDENRAAALCYTSGTTGDPKGVLYSHRSTVLHTMMSLSTDTIGIGARAVAAPIVPMFHANAWGFPYGATMTGAKLVLNGPHHDAETIWTIFDAEEVTVTAAVPTIWLQLLDYLRRTGKGLPHLEAVTIGGSAAPRAMIEAFEKEYGVRVHHAWGMTETSPLGTVGTMTRELAALPYERQLDFKVKQGRAIFGVELKIVDDEGRRLPHDGRSSGHLMVRGPWVARAYFHRDEKILDDEGFFDTGDIATIDEYGFMQITDRAKDVIKSGGEWISSIDLENAAVAHPKVKEAAVIGVAHPKWFERPLLVVVPEDPADPPTLEEMRRLLARDFAKWWLPDALEIVDEIPHSATGKIDKKTLRQRFRDYRLATEEATGER
ncbi:MAG: hypothetical protein KatS3mg119_0579 [Rhodothalassiaceae bacterium]|nr:MAG: hypothetical protein KatS3mg119_0579 [Rhodothalassiaceae bacterium]